MFVVLFAPSHLRFVLILHFAVDLPLLEFTPESDPIESEITVEFEGDFFVETVNVFLDLDHSSRGHLHIRLTSPSGTTSVLSPGPRPENTVYEGMWKLITVKNWGEEPAGVWKISLEDERPGDVVECEDDEYTFEFVSEFGNETLFCEDFSDYCSGLNDDYFGDIDVTGPNDPYFTGLEGTSAGDACCDCGGGCKFSHAFSGHRGFFIDTHMCS